MITNICAIDRYEGPQWLIDPEQDPWDETPDDGDAEVIATLNARDGVTWEILETDVMGWGQHTHIIRTRGGYGDDDYLATITPDPPPTSGAPATSGG